MVEPFECVTFTDEAIKRAAHKRMTHITLADPGAAPWTLCHVHTCAASLCVLICVYEIRLHSVIVKQ